MRRRKEEEEEEKSEEGGRGWAEGRRGASPARRRDERRVLLRVANAAREIEVSAWPSFPCIERTGPALVARRSTASMFVVGRQAGVESSAEPKLVLTAHKTFDELHPV
jgi:hypothetical protein